MQEIFKNGSTISYGKRKNLPPGIVEDYLILPDSTKGFTSDEKNNFEKICKSFSWTSTSNPGEILPPCYGFFPFGDGSIILVARFIDDGRDNQGRADLLRVDALKVPSQLFHELKSDLSFVFDSSIWKHTFAVENSIAESTVISLDDCAKIFELVKKSITVPLLVGCSKNFKFKPTSGKFNTFDINSKTVEEISVPVVSMPPNPSGLIKISKPSSPVVGGGETRLVGPLLFGIFVLIICWVVFKVNEQNLVKEKTKLTEKNTELTKENKNLFKGNTKLTEENKNLIKANTKLTEENTDLATKNDILAKLKNFNVDDLMEKLGDKPDLKIATEVLSDIKIQAQKSFVKEIEGKLKNELQKEMIKLQKTMTDWLDKQIKPDPK